MKTTLCSMLFAGLLAGGSSGLAASPEAGAEAGTERVTVIFEHPEKFTDLKDNVGDYENERGRERFLPFLKEHLEKRAEKILPAGQKLTVTFTDIDLAGDFEAWHGMAFHDVRIVKHLYVPRMTFSFVLTDASGQVLKEGERRLIDGAFQLRSGSSFNQDFLRYEKEMLNDWLRKDIRPQKT